MRQSPGVSPTQGRRNSLARSISPRRRLSTGWINDQLGSSYQRRHQSRDGRSYSPVRLPHREEQIPHSFGTGPEQANNKFQFDNEDQPLPSVGPIENPEMKDFLPDLCSILAGLFGCGCLTEICSLLPKLCGLLPHLCGMLDKGNPASQNSPPLSKEQEEKLFRTENHSFMVKENTILVNKQKFLVRTQTSQDNEITPLISNDEALEETQVTSIAVESSHSSSNTTVTSVQSSSSLETNTSQGPRISTTQAQPIATPSPAKIQENIFVTTAQVHAQPIPWQVVPVSNSF